MKFEPAGEECVAILAALHAEGFEQPWPADEIARLLASPSAYAIVARAEEGAAPAGFVLAWSPAAEAEILTLAVRPAARRQGAGAGLVTAAIVSAMVRGADAMLLEVAEDNAPARALYEKLGFVETARRRSYYTRREGGADAIVLRRIIPRPRL